MGPAELAPAAVPDAAASPGRHCTAPGQLDGKHGIESPGSPAPLPFAPEAAPLCAGQYPPCALTCWRVDCSCCSLSSVFCSTDSQHAFSFSRRFRRLLASSPALDSRSSLPALFTVSTVAWWAKTSFFSTYMRHVGQMLDISVNALLLPACSCGLEPTQTLHERKLCNRNGSKSDIE